MPVPFISETARSFENLDTLRQYLAYTDVRESKPFRLEDMTLTSRGTVQVADVGELPLSEIALKDALHRGGLHTGTCEKFFEQEEEVLDEVIVEAANRFYRHSKQAISEVKLVTRAGVDDTRVVLGIPSRRYALFTHEMAVEKVSKNVSPNMKLARANVYPEHLEISFTDPVNTAKDAVGEIVELGCSFLNSQGTRTRALIASAFSLRLVCSNGATAKDRHFSARYPHRGDLFNGNGKFGNRIAEITVRFAAMMRELPRLGEIPVTDKLLSQIEGDLVDAVKAKKSKRFLEEFRMPGTTVMDVWNRITNLPHEVKGGERKLKLEELGFKILTLNLGHFYN